MNATLTPGRDGIPVGFGIPADVLRALFGQHPAGVLHSPAITSSSR